MRERARTPSILKHLAERVLLSSAGYSTTTAGALATRAWLRSMGLAVPGAGWSAECLLSAGEPMGWADVDNPHTTCFGLEMSNREWGFFVCHRGQSSYIRVTDVPFVLERDDFSLVGLTPPLRDLGLLLRSFEAHHDVQFSRAPVVRTTVPGLESELRRWFGAM